MNSKQLYDFYNGSYHSSIDKNLKCDDKYFWARSRAAVDLYFDEVSDNSKIFEYGVGIGQNIASFKNSVGYDISVEALNACRMRGIQVSDNMDSIPDANFDVALSRHSLEHVPDPLESLIQIRNKLKLGGMLILVLPKERHGKASFDTDINNHLFCWNFRTINNLLNVAGFRPILNITKYSMGYQLLLPFHKILGYRIYLYMVKIAGRLSGLNGELIIRALKVEF